MDSEKLAGCREEFEKWITAQSTPSMLPIRRYGVGYMDRFIDGQWDAFRQAWTRPGVTVPVEPTEELKAGDYVLATKFNDGDPADPWGVGYYVNFDGHHHIVDGAGKVIYGPNGFRRAQKISAELGDFLITNSRTLENMAHATTPEIFSLWMLAARPSEVSGDK